MALTAGSRLGPYEILSALGAGGMGEVYRAKDTKLQREVAIKVLRALFATDPDRLARFQREAQVLASLNHHNIGSIYGLEELDGARALVLELVEGPTLADRIAQGPIPIDEALTIARQIAEALEAAHEQGIIHRDLKPANIKLRPDGTVKVLDFGLAKLVDPDAVIGLADVTASPTITSPAMMTGVGVLLGTAAYMSPEQAKGRTADKRSDIWAFGCVLHEMLSGQRAFKGDDVADTLAAVLRQDIDWTGLPTSTPASVRRLLARCLNRDVRRRLRDIGEARIVLDDPGAIAIRGAESGASLSPLRPAWRRAIPVGLWAIVAGVLASAATVYLRPSPAPLVVTRFPFTLGEGQVFPAGTRQLVAISPDGAHMAYLVNGRGLYLRSMSEVDARLIAGADAEKFLLNPVFSPDSGSVAFWSNADETIKRVAVSGGPAVTICPADPPFGMSWGTTGIVFGQRNRGIMRVSANGGTPSVLARVQDGEEAQGPQMLPGGETLLFTLATGTTPERWDRAQIVTQSLRTGERKTLIDGGSDARYVPTGHLVYAVGGTVFAVPMDLRRLEVTGGPVPIVEGVRRSAGNTTGATHFDFSSSGSLMYVPGPVLATAAPKDLALIDRKGGAEPLRLPPGAYEFPRVSPDGKRLAFGTDDGQEVIVWIYELGSTTSMRRLTFGGKNRFPIWSADGQRVAFQSDREGDLGIFWQRADGSGAAERLTTPDQGTSHVPESWSPQGGVVAVHGVQGVERVTMDSLLAGQENHPGGGRSVAEPHQCRVFARRPMGRLHSHRENGRVQGIRAAVPRHRRPVPGLENQRDLSSVVTRWTRTRLPTGGRLLGCPNHHDQTELRVQRSQAPPRGGAITSGPTGRRNYDVASDGRILGVVAAGQTQSAVPVTPQIQVVLNWFEDVKRRVSTK